MARRGLERANVVQTRGKKSPTLKSLIKALDDVFSKFIRCRDADRHTGMSWCRTCGAPGRWQDFQCGHYLKRRFLGTRWDERNCNTQCGICNGPRRGAEPEHAAYITRTYGIGILDELLAAKRMSLKLTCTDLQAKIENYQERLAKLNG
jgi:hypothetical protein